MCRPSSNFAPFPGAICRCHPPNGELTPRHLPLASRHSVTVRRVLPNHDGEGTTYYRIAWCRQTERKKLYHLDGRPLRAADVVPELKGSRLVYLNGLEVSVQCVYMEAENADDDGVPRLEIEFECVTTQLTRTDTV